MQNETNPQLVDNNHAAPIQPQQIIPTNQAIQAKQFQSNLQQATAQPALSEPIAPQNPQPPKKSVLKKLFIVVASIIGALILIGGVGFFALIAWFFHSADSICGLKSPTHKAEVSKVAVFNNVSVLPGQPNQPASIYDSSDGTCNLDVAQSYSATKSFTVNMNGATALSTVTNNLSKQGFTLSQQVFSYGEIDSSCSTSIWGWANYTGRSTTITVVFGSPTKQCTNPPETYLVGVLPSVTQAQFANSAITSIKATVSTPTKH